MKVKTTINIFYTQYAWEQKGTYEVLSFKPDDSDHRTYISSQEIEIDVPDNYDPRAKQIEVLQAQKHKIMADYQKTVTEINARISKLQAIEHTA